MGGIFQWWGGGECVNLWLFGGLPPAPPVGKALHCAPHCAPSSNEIGYIER